jgi:hypothetical protein
MASSPAPTPDRLRWSSPRQPQRGDPKTAHGWSDVSAANVAQPWVGVLLKRSGQNHAMIWIETSNRSGASPRQPQRGDPKTAHGWSDVSAANVAQPWVGVLLKRSGQNHAMIWIETSNRSGASPRQPQRGDPKTAHGWSDVSAANVAQPWVGVLLKRSGQNHAMIWIETSNRSGASPRQPQRGDPKTAHGWSDVSAANVAQPWVGERRDGAVERLVRHRDQVDRRPQFNEFRGGQMRSRPRGAKTPSVCLAWVSGQSHPQQIVAALLVLCFLRVALFEGTDCAGSHNEPSANSGHGVARHPTARTVASKTVVERRRMHRPEHETSPNHQL